MGRKFSENNSWSLVEEFDSREKYSMCLAEHELYRGLINDNLIFKREKINFFSMEKDAGIETKFGVGCHYFQSH